MNNNQNSNPQFNNDSPMTPNNNVQINDMHQHDNKFLNNVENNQNNSIDELNQFIKTTPNRFINNDVNQRENSLNSLNIETGNEYAPRVDYSKDPMIQEKINQMENPKPKKNTITITSEGKVFIAIVIVLLLFIFVLPTIFDYIRDIQYK